MTLHSKSLNLTTLSLEKEGSEKSSPIRTLERSKCLSSTKSSAISFCSPTLTSSISSMSTIWTWLKHGWSSTTSALSPKTPSYSSLSRQFWCVTLKTNRKATNYLPTSITCYFPSPIRITTELSCPGCVRKQGGQ